MGAEPQLSSGDMFTTPREPDAILSEALSFSPKAIYAAFSGGDTSLAMTHWMMSNVPGCRVFHANTGIGVEAAREFVRETCDKYGWPLDEIRAKEDCGQDYRQMVLRHGFPGPAMHHRMYARLKERPVRLLVKRAKTKRTDKIMIATGLYKEESAIRMGYGDRNVNFVGAQMWVNTHYWWPKSRFMDYIRQHKLQRSPVSEVLGMSGECLCGAHAHPGEKALVRLIEPKTADYLDELESEVRAAGHNWGWEDRPPKDKETTSTQIDLFTFCRGCEKRGFAK